MNRHTPAPGSLRYIALIAAAKAHDTEEASQKGEPSPWTIPEAISDEEWRGERVAAMSCGIDAYLMQVEASILQSVIERLDADRKGGHWGSADGDHIRDQTYIRAISAVKAMQRDAADIYARAIDEAMADPVLTLQELRNANAARQLEWDEDNQLTLAYRGNEFAGEAGEVCNVIKKLERERMGIRGSRDTVEHLGEELADAVMTADLIANQAGVNLTLAIIKKFNATSEAHGLQTRIPVR